MKRSALVATVALVLAGFWATAAFSESNSNPESTPQRHPVPSHCKIGPFRAFSAAVWAVGRWRRGNPPEKVIAALERRISCAPPGHRRAMVRTWQRNRAAYFAHRKAMIWRRTVEPYYGCTDGGCGYWAIPAVSVQCESAGGTAASNIYGNLANYHGGSKWEQSLSAYRLLEEYGGGLDAYRSVWLQWESGCAGWPWGY